MQTTLYKRRSGTLRRTSFWMCLRRAGDLPVHNGRGIDLVEGGGDRLNIETQGQREVIIRDTASGQPGHSLGTTGTQPRDNRANDLVQIS